MKHINKNAIGLFLVGLAVSTAAFAGADSTFAGPVTTLTGWLNGSMGTLFAVGALVTGLATSISTQRLIGVAIGVGIAIAAKAGPSVLSTITSMTI